jgi:hypothetical protein
MSSTGWIGVDLDGTLAHYDHWRGATHIGAPVALMLDRVKNWIADGREVRVFTARVSGPPEEAQPCRQAIAEWMAANGLPNLPVTNIKDYQMLELWDDRAVQVYPNTGVPVGQSTRGLS